MSNPQRDANGRFMKREIAVTADHSQRLHFAEELDIFRIHTKRIARAVVELDIAGLDSRIEMPDIEAEAIDAVDGGKHAVTEAVEDLDEAASEDSKTRRELKKWRKELDEQREELGLAA